MNDTLLILLGCTVFLTLVCAIALIVVCSRLGALQAAVKKLGGGGLPALWEPDIRVEPLYAQPVPAAAPAPAPVRFLPGGRRDADGCGRQDRRRAHGHRGGRAAAPAGAASFRLHSGSKVSK